MRTYKIKADQELFDAWQVMGQRVKNMSAIVQNNMELTEDDLREWEEDSEGLKKMLDDLLIRTDEYLAGSAG